MAISLYLITSLSLLPYNNLDLDPTWNRLKDASCPALNLPSCQAMVAATRPGGSLARHLPPPAAQGAKTADTHDHGAGMSKATWEAIVYG